MGTGKHPKHLSFFFSFSKAGTKESKVKHVQDHTRRDDESFRGQSLFCLYVEETRYNFVLALVSSTKVLSEEVAYCVT